MNQILFGCDVSSYQPSTLVPWDDTRIDFGIVKATEGIGIDSALHLHVAAIRKANKALGLYHFFHPEVDVIVQFNTFKNIACSGIIQKGDIVPAIDIESFGATHGVTPSWSAPLKALVDLFTENFGNALLYIGVNSWVFMGKPDWVGSYPLWVPHYMYDGYVPPPWPLSASSCPCKKPATIWQGRVSPLFQQIQNDKAVRAVDQNWAAELPRIS